MLSFKKDRAWEALTLFTSANLQINGRVIAHCRVILSEHFDKIRGVYGRWVGLVIAHPAEAKEMKIF